MNRSSRSVWICAGLLLALVTSGCATPTLMSKPKASSKSSSSSTAKRSSKAAPGGSSSADEIPDAHAVGLSVKGG